MPGRVRFGAYRSTRDLLRLQRELPGDVTAHGDDATRIVRVRRGEVELVADFGNRTVTIDR